MKNEDDHIFVSLTSSGRSAETLGVTSLLGLYKYAGTHNEVCDILNPQNVLVLF